MRKAGPEVAFAILLALTAVSDPASSRDGMKLAEAVSKADVKREFVQYRGALCRSEPDLGTERSSANPCVRRCYKDEECGWVQVRSVMSEPGEGPPGGPWVSHQLCEMYTKCEEYHEQDDVLMEYEKSQLIMARIQHPKKEPEFFIPPNGVQRMVSQCSLTETCDPFKTLENVKNWKSCMKKCQRKKKCKHFEFFKDNKVCKLFKGVVSLAFSPEKNVKSGTRLKNNPGNRWGTDSEES